MFTSTCNFNFVVHNFIFYANQIKAKNIELKVIKKISISKKELQKLEKEIKQEFPNDRMMYELHVLRALRSRYWLKEDKTR